MDKAGAEVQNDASSSMVSADLALLHHQVKSQCCAATLLAVAWFFFRSNEFPFCLSYRVEDYENFNLLASG